MENSTLRYTFGNDSFDADIVFVLGVSRSGKSLLSRLLGSATNIEWIFEPSVVYYFLQSVGLGYSDPYVSSSILRAASKEIIQDRVLLRNANFRATDISSIFGHKDVESIINRLYRINSRDDVQEFIKTNGVVFLFDIPDVLNRIKYIKKVFPKARIIHVVRSGCDVIGEVLLKAWYSYERIQSRQDNYVAYYDKNVKGSSFYIPWWLPDDRIGDFINGSNITRASLYWICNLNMIKNEELIDVTLRYEDIVKKTEEIIEQLRSIIPIRESYKTIQLIKEMDMTKISKNRLDVVSIEKSINDNDVEIFHKIMRRYNYE